MVKQESSIKNFWIAFLAVVAAVAIGAAIFVGITSANKISLMRMSVVDDENYYKMAEENNYKHSLYAACDSLKNLDANLGKVAISSSSANQAQMLTNVIIHANQINQNLANLPISESDNLEACQRFVNQTQDYATYLLKKICQGENLTIAERASLNDLDNVATEMYNFLQNYAESDSGLFITNGNGMNNYGTLSDSLNEVKENSFSYEKLIYDGPFSESIEEKTVPMGKAISTQKGSEIVAKLFGENTFAQKINNKGEWYSYQLQNGRVLLTADGRVAQFEAYDLEQTGDNSCDCLKIAEEFCQKLGYDVKGIWISKTQEDTTYVNCATVIDGVIIYPDLIKVAVSSSGNVVGCEARAYLLNHGDWNVEFGAISQEDAQKSVDSSLKVTNVAKSLIEKGGEQHLCYEFECQMGDRQYYVYVDSNTGNEVEIFKVIQNTEGHTVM